MKRVARFEKVSRERFIKDWISTFSSDKLVTDANRSKEETMQIHRTDESRIKYINKIYDDIKLPRRATTGSAGYDFYSPIGFELNPGETILIPTGIRVKIDEGWVLKCYPRSGLGFKYRLQLNNTVGIIDSDYYYSDNEGHIFSKLTNDSKEGKAVNIDKGAGFMQGIFVEYGITYDDDTSDIRNGGFGSTS
ncbi:MAG TPA: deoxyuridine 5'-triphosphate nucleotidohydrolase [Clostridiales bacterium]|jgi:dUTP pyrophosphatase|nr:deoxyuridine 5'-triphosphate nucleotidohydrolase [Clostridiales bacterium]